MSETNDNMNLTKEERAFFVKSLWEALQAPSWTKDDLIEFGKAIFGKLPLKGLDERKFNQLFPFLVQISNVLGAKIKIDWQTRIVQEILDTMPKVAPLPTAPIADPTPIETVQATPLPTTPMTVAIPAKPPTPPRNESIEIIPPTNKTGASHE